MRLKKNERPEMGNDEMCRSKEDSEVICFYNAEEREEIPRSCRIGDSKDSKMEWKTESREIFGRI